jgi:hypothetical protein
MIADQSLQEQGVWIPLRDDAEFLLAYAGRKKYRDKLGRLSARVRRMNRGRELTASELDQITVDTMVGTVVLDWKGLTLDQRTFDMMPPELRAKNKAKETFVYNEENAKWWLLVSAELRDYLFAEASNILNFQEAAKEDEAASTALADTKSGTEIPVATGEGVTSPS